MRVSEKAALAGILFGFGGFGITLVACAPQESEIAPKPQAYDIICVSGGRPILQAEGVTDAYVGGSNGVMGWKDGSHEYFSTADCIARRAL